ncbi:MAG: amidoligase family protein, partial [Polyangiales bacterium]
MTDTHPLDPPLSSNPEGEPRRTGVEVELNKVTVAQICEAIQGVFGGDVEFDTEYEAKVVTPSGKFDVLVDAKWALKLAGPPEDEVQQGDDDDTPVSDRILKSLADLVVPLEIASPPLPVTAFSDLDRVVDELGAMGGRGTNDSLLNAFGVHFNPELPGFEAELIVRYLQAFVIMQDWLLQTIEIDFTRRATPFIDRFPTDYATLVLDAGYQPSIETLIDDYLLHNPTRNRALDMLPLFAHLDEQRVRQALPEEKINARPTFHYRMANSRVGEPEWSISLEWQAWLEVEKLVVKPELLRDLAAEYRTLLGKPIDSLFTNWGAEVRAR